MNRSLVIANLAICLGLLAVGLWPFRFFPENNVKWLPDQTGISLGGGGILFSPKFLTVENGNSRPSREDAVTLEIWAEALSEPHNVAHILSFYGRRDEEKFFIGQWNSLLLLQAKNSVEASAPSRKLGVTDGLPINQARVLTITSSVAGTALYLDGQLRDSSSHQFLNSDSLSGRIVLGDSDTANNRWKGNLFGLAVYDHALNPREVSGHYRYWKTGSSSALAREEGIRALYPFDDRTGDRLRDSMGRQNDIVIPPYFGALKKEILVPPWDEHFPNWHDIAKNVAGFVPLGLLLFALFRNMGRYSLRRCVVQTILIGALISLTIELVQVYLPDRSSSLTDLVANTFGTAVGFVVYAFSYQLFRRISGLARVGFTQPDSSSGQV